MSGFTTTGATILDDVECFHGLLFWRSLTQWIGGLGIVFFTIAPLPSLVGGQTKVFAEATGPIKSILSCIPVSPLLAKWHLEYLPGAHHRMHPLLLYSGNESLRQLQLRDDHHGYGWFLYPQ